jgi:hypothetical protein
VIAVNVDLFTTNEWFVLFIFFSLILTAIEVGFRLGRNAAPKTVENTKARISIIEASLVGVLGLLLSFTLSMAVSRFEVRKQLVLEEANAIGTSFLRTQLLPVPESTEIGDLVRDYVDVRIRYAGAGGNLEQLNAVRRQAVRLQNQFWACAVAYGRKDPNPVRAGLLLQSLNNVIDLEASRWMALFNHIPEPVIYVNAIIALLAAALVGYGFGVECRRQIFSMGLLAVAITLVLGVIIDMDRPRHGFIQVSQQPMIDLQRQLRITSR